MPFAGRPTRRSRGWTVPTRAATPASAWSSPRSGSGRSTVTRDGPRSCGRWGSRSERLSSVLGLGCRLDLARLDRALQRGVILLVLVRIGDRETGDHLVERLAPAHVAAQLDGDARARVGERERPTAPLGVQLHLQAAERLHAHADLDVAQLADEVVALGPLRPAEEHVARGLHEPVALDDALPVTRVRARAGEWLEDRSPRLLHLEEQGVALACHVEEHPALRAHAADPHHLDRRVT